MASILKVDTLQKPDGSTPTAADLGIDVAGSVVQVQQVIYTSTAVDNTSNVMNNWPGSIGTGITITPKSSNSKFLIRWTLYISRNNGLYTCHNYLTRVIDGVTNTDICIGDASGNRTRCTFGVRSASGGIIEPSRNGEFLDSPNTTSPVTYKFMYRNATGVSYSGNTLFNHFDQDYNDTGSGTRPVSMLTVYEIA